MNRSRLKAPAIALTVGGLVLGLSAPAAARETKHLISGSTIKEHSIAGNRLKNATITSTQIKNGTITGKQIKAGSITGTQVKPGSITGTQVNASTLGAVPDANALGGVTASRFGKPVAFDTVIPKSTASTQQLFTMAGLGTVDAGCASNGQPIITYFNDTGASQDIVVTMNVPGDSPPSVSGPPFGYPGNIGYQLSNMIWTFDGVNSANSDQNVDLRLTAYTNTAGTCAVTVWGTSSIAITIPL